MSPTHEVQPALLMQCARSDDVTYGGKTMSHVADPGVHVFSSRPSRFTNVTCHVQSTKSVDPQTLVKG